MILLWLRTLVAHIIPRNHKQGATHENKSPSIQDPFCVLLLGILTMLPEPQRSPRPPRRLELYRFVLVQAVPGKLLDLIDLYRKRIPIIKAGGDEIPFHYSPLAGRSVGSGGDLSFRSFTEYYSKDRISKRTEAADASGVVQPEFARKFYELCVLARGCIHGSHSVVRFSRRHVKDPGWLHSGDDARRFPCGKRMC